MSQRPAFVMAVASGKGGVGKTSLTTNLGIALAAKGDRVCVFDADTGLANINILLRMHPEYTLADVLVGEKQLEEVLMEGPRGMHIVPAASGLEGVVELSQEQKLILSQTLETLQSTYDYLLLDMAAGVGDTVMTMLRMTPNLLMVVTSEPTSLTDAFSLLKVLKRSGAEPSIRVLVNQVSDEKMAEKIFRRFASAVEKYLEYDLSYMGKIPQDNAVIEAVRFQKPLLELSPNAYASVAIRSVADRLRLLRPNSSEAMALESLNPSGVVNQASKPEAVEATQGGQMAKPEAVEETQGGQEAKPEVVEATQDSQVAKPEAAEKLQEDVRKIHLKEAEPKKEQAQRSVPRSAPVLPEAITEDWQRDLLAGIHFAALYGEQESA